MPCPLSGQATSLLIYQDHPLFNQLLQSDADAVSIVIGMRGSRLLVEGMAHLSDYTTGEHLMDAVLVHTDVLNPQEIHLLHLLRWLVEILSRVSISILIQ